MPQIDESNASKATDTLTRRAAAAAVDLCLVGLPTALFALLSAERFQIIEFNDGRARFALEDQVRINEIDTGLNRAMQFGDTVFTLSGIGLMLTMLVLTTLTVLVFFIVPGLRRGQTPGRSILGLPVRPDDTTDVEVISVSVTDADIEADPDEADGFPTEPFNAAKKPDAAKDEIRHESSSARQPDAPSIDDVYEAEQTIATDGILIVPSGPIDSGLHQTTLDLDVREQNDEQDHRANRLRQELEAEIENGSRSIQVTLGNDDDYAEWDELDGLNLTDRPEKNNGRENPFETLTLPESSLSETPLTATNGRSGRSPVPESQSCATATVERKRKTEDEVRSEITPEWSPEWQSWVYLDEANRRWFRHDQAADRWIPIN